MPWRRRPGVPFAIALGGALSLLIGVAALAWGRRHSLEIVPGGSVGAPTGGTMPGAARTR